MAVITIGPQNFIQGESQSDWISDRGFSSDSNHLNLTKIRGMLYFSPTPTERGGATLTGNIVAATHDASYLGNDGYFADDEGNFYYINGATLTKAQTTASQLPILGTSEAVYFKTALYVSTSSQIMQLTGSNLTGIDAGWWVTGIDTNYRHPMERVESKLYIGDINEIHTWDGTTSTAAEITLPTDVNITSLRKHPDGKTLIAFCGLTANYSHTRGGGGRIYLVDPNTRSWTREIDVEMQIEGSRVAGGVVYVSYGSNIGYFNGNGIAFLKKLSTSTTTYSHNMVAYEDFLVIRDGRDALAFGDLGAGKVWWRLYRNLTNTAHINCMLYKGDNVMLYAYADGTAGNLDEVDYDNAGTTGTFTSNRYVFPQKVKINRFEIIHDVSNNAGTTAFNILYRDTENNTYTLAAPSYVNQSTTKTEFFTDLETDIFQFQITPSSDDTGYKLIRIHYEPIN